MLPCNVVLTITHIQSFYQQSKGQRLNDLLWSEISGLASHCQPLLDEYPPFHYLLTKCASLCAPVLPECAFRVHLLSICNIRTMQKASQELASLPFPYSVTELGRLSDRTSMPKQGALLIYKKGHGNAADVWLVLTKAVSTKQRIEGSPTMKPAATRVITKQTPLQPHVGLTKLLNMALIGRKSPQ